MTGKRGIGLAVVSVAVVLGIWELAVSLGILDPLYASSPSRTAAAAIGLAGDPNFSEHVRVSGIEFLAAFFAAAALGTLLGLLAGWDRRIIYTVEPVVTAAYVTPMVAFLPVAVLWFGYGPQTTTIVAFFGAFSVVFLNALAGTKTVDPLLVRASKSFSASRVQIFRTIIVPSTVPHIITGLRLGVGRALIGVVLGEIFAASAGLGYYIHIAGATLQIDRMFVAILIVSLAGLASNVCFTGLERRVSSWRPPLREV